MALAEDNEAINKEGARNDESSVCSTPLPPLEKLDRAEPHLKGHDGSSKRSRTPRPSKHFFPPCIHCRIGIKPRNLQHVMKSYETCGSTVHTTTYHNDIEWFRRGEAIQAKKAEALKLAKAESSNANRSKTPTKRVNILKSIDEGPSKMEKFKEILDEGAKVATQQWELFCTNSGKMHQQWELSSGNTFALTVGKCTSGGIFITSSRNDLEHFIPNNPPLNLMLYLQSSFLALSTLFVVGLSAGLSTAFTNLIARLDKMVLYDALVSVTKGFLFWRSSEDLEQHAFFSELELDFTIFLLLLSLNVILLLIKASHQALIPLVVPEIRIFYLRIRKSSISFNVDIKLVFNQQWQLSSGNSFALTVGKCTSSGNSAVGMLLH
nr:hypothetical protein [Tanacetum cinerariifolium]